MARVPIGPCQVFFVVWMTLQQSWMCFCSPTKHPKSANVILLGVLSLDGCLISRWHCFIHRTSGFSPRKGHRGLQHSVAMRGCLTAVFYFGRASKMQLAHGKVELRWHRWLRYLGISWDILGYLGISWDHWRISGCQLLSTWDTLLDLAILIEEV